MLSQRKAKIDDLPKIIDLLIEDDLGKSREVKDLTLNQKYTDAFYKIDEDKNQYLMVVENCDEIVGTCHLTIMSSLTFIGSTRMQIEVVRVAGKLRGQKIGEWMMKEAIEYGKSRGVLIMQLTTNKKRQKAKAFYEKLAFKATHEGMKLYL